MEPGPPALGAWSLSHWTTTEVPCQLLSARHWTTPFRGSSQRPSSHPASAKRRLTWAESFPRTWLSEPDTSPSLRLATCRQAQALEGLSSDPYSGLVLSLYTEFYWSRSWSPSPWQRTGQGWGTANGTALIAGTQTVKTQGPQVRVTIRRWAESLPSRMGPGASGGGSASGFSRAPSRRWGHWRRP